MKNDDFTVKLQEKNIKVLRFSEFLFFPVEVPLSKV